MHRLISAFNSHWALTASHPVVRAVSAHMHACCLRAIWQHVHVIAVAFWFESPDRPIARWDRWPATRRADGAGGSGEGRLRAIRRLPDRDRAVTTTTDLAVTPAHDHATDPTRRDGADCDDDQAATTVDGSGVSGEGRLRAMPDGAERNRAVTTTRCVTTTRAFEQCDDDDGADTTRRPDGAERDDPCATMT